MERNPFAPDITDFPEEIPIFPLDGVLLLPGGCLPLNIFEPRYKEMVDYAFKNERMIGIIQPLKKSPENGDHHPEAPLNNVGCAGKITEMRETEDGRYIITLTGLMRFDIHEELGLLSGFRRVTVSWKRFNNDVSQKSCLDLDREKLRALLEKYFDKQEMNCDWEAMDCVADNKLITCLSMICPFDSIEKQALLEAEVCKDRAALFMKLLEMAIHEGKTPTTHN